MVKLCGLPSILESLYLEEQLTTKIREITIEVNPVNLKFLSGKTIIINSRDYVLPAEHGYCNTIISRVKECQSSDITYLPYLPKVIPNIVWNGMYVDSLEEAEDVYLFDEKTIYFPKINNFNVSDEDLDYLGFLEYQVGYNFFENSPFQDLDILKCRKGLI